MEAFLLLCVRRVKRNLFILIRSLYVGTEES